MSLTLTSELEVVNHLLNKVGEYPVATLDLASNPPIVSIARTCIDAALRRILQRGWECNTWTRAYHPDSSGKIAVGNTVLEIYSASQPVALRDGMLFDRVAETYRFTGPVTLEAVYLLELTDLPQTMRDYVTASAAFDFQSGLITDSLLIQITTKELEDAKIAAVQADARAGRHNLLDETPEFQPWGRLR